MTGFLDLFRSNFLLHNALWGSIAVGFFCPIIGVYFMLRRMVLLGVALPQVSSAGVAFAFFLQSVGVTWSLHAGETNDKLLALVGSLLFTLTAILILAVMERKGQGTVESRVGAVFAFAYAAAILFVSTSPTGKIEVLNMLHGEIVSVSARDLHWLLGVFFVLGTGLLVWGRQFFLVSFDREFAQVMGKNVLLWDTLLFGIIAVALSASVLIVGPMMTFAFLIIPPLAARRFCTHFPSFSLLSSLLGGISGLVGFYVSYQLDWPLGPTDILTASIVLFGAFLIKKLLP